MEKIIRFLVITLCLGTCWCQIEYEIAVVQYDNPLGTVFVNNEQGGDRKCCDTGGSACKAGNDTCDVIFLFCLGEYSTDPMSPGCNGSSVDMSDDVTHDVFAIKGKDYSHLKRFSNLTHWTPNATQLIARVVDLDDFHSSNGDIVELIDEFTQPLAFRPAASYLAAPPHRISLLRHISLDVELRVWCARGWYGPLCQTYCQHDNFHTCNASGQIQLAPQCSPDTLVLPVSQPLSQLYDRPTLQSALVRFMSNTGCPTTATNATVQLQDIQENRYDNDTLVMFRGYCDGAAMSRLRLQQILLAVSIATGTRIGGLDQQFGLPLHAPGYKGIQETSSGSLLSVVFLLRIIEYENQGVTNCSQGGGTADGCNPKMRICLTGKRAVCNTISAVNTSHLVDCNGTLADPTSATITRTYPSSWLAYLTRMPSSILVMINDFQHNSVILSQKSLPLYGGRLTMGANFLGAFPKRFNIKGSTSLTIEISGWCLNCYHGDTCQTKSSSPCNPSETILTPECTKDSDCSGRGACFNKTCVCPNGWNGPTCNMDVDECASGTCQHSSTCTNTPGGYTCTCNAGFTGANCDVDIDECLINRCHGGAICLNTFGNYSCACENGTQAQDCGYDFCEKIPCLNNGTCTSNADNYTCKCLPGWEGERCQTNINECTRDTPCKNGATCLDTPGSYNCTCPSTWTGPHCDMDYDECYHATQECQHASTCINLEGSYQCMCNSGYDGPHCGIDKDECNATVNPCNNSGLCRNNPGSYKCTCVAGWLGQNCDQDRDECREYPCQNEGNCVNTPGSFSCQCQPGWSGSHCQQDVDECLTAGACNLHGNCTNRDGGYSCQCFSGWNGYHCDADINECTSSNPCQNGGTCSNTNGSYMCTCPPNWTGKNCTANVDECGMLSPCQNGGTCVDSPGNYTCACPSTWTGQNCTVDVNECTTLPSPCSNHGTCRNTNGSYTCSCSSRWKGQKCQIDVNECSNMIAVCANGGICTNTPGAYTCACSAGWTGQNCLTNINECTLFPNTSICAHGSCVDTPGSYTCNCVNGYTGQNCTVDINECSSNPCQNSGKCSNNNGAYRCNCPRAWTGLNCDLDVDECALFHPCQNNAKCINDRGSYQCNCQSGWNGRNCDTDIDECQGNPCLHSSTCHNTPGSYNCACSPGWQGNICGMDADECYGVDCQHGGVCQDGLNKFTCMCAKGFTGTLCETDINECTNSPCQNGGHCVNHPGYYKCVCSPGWTGQFCELDIDECKTSPCGAGRRCENTQGNYTCIKEFFKPTTTMLTSTTAPPSVDVFSLQFAGPISAGDRPRVQQGIHDILQLLTCSNSKHIYVSLVQNSVNTPDTVQFHAQCDGQHLSNNQVNAAIRTLSADKLATYFPQKLAGAPTPKSKTSVVPIVAGAVGGVLAVVIIVIIVAIVKRKQQQSLPHHDRFTNETNETVAETIQEMDGTQTLTMHNPTYNTLYAEDTMA